jgi:hypothetical protein
VWLGSINKQLEEVLWCTGKRSSSWVRAESDWKKVPTERRQWRTMAA